MPTGVPPPEELTTREVGAFALDTSVIQGASYSFSSGALARLADQLPPWLNLWLTDIVAREVMQHRMDSVRRAAQQIRGGYSDIRRFLAGAEIRLLPDPEDYVSSAIHHFDSQLQWFLKSHHGTLIEPQSGGLVMQVFKRYFDQTPPFGGGRDKKHEFPDAASLLMLESHAHITGTKVIAVSGDEGWHNFARTSDMIYCVRNLSELTNLFVATSPSMLAFAGEVEALLNEKDFEERVARLLSKQLPTLPWLLKTRNYGYEVDAGVVNAILDSFHIKTGSLQVWATAHDESACVAHVAVEVESKLEIEAYAFQRKYKALEKEDLAHTSLVVNQGLEVSLVLEFVGLKGTSTANAALRNVSVTSEPLPVHLGWIIFPGIQEPRWAWDDDIPF